MAVDGSAEEAHLADGGEAILDQRVQRHVRNRVMHLRSEHRQSRAAPIANRTVQRNTSVTRQIG